MASSDNAGARHDEPGAAAERSSSPATVDAPDAATAESEHGDVADGDAADADAATANGPGATSSAGDAPPASPLSKVRAAWRARARSDDNDNDDNGDDDNADETASASSGTATAAGSTDDSAGSGSDDTSGELIVEQVARPLISGDPLLTGPTPVVRKSKRSPKPPASDASAAPVAEPVEQPSTETVEHDPARPEATDEAGPPERAGATSGPADVEARAEPATSAVPHAESASTDDSSPARDRPDPSAPGGASATSPQGARPDPHDLLTPGPGSNPSGGPSSAGPADLSGPIPAPSGTAPPPAPILRPTSAPTAAPGGRQALRGRQATGPIPAVTQRAAPAGDPSGPVTRPTAVAPAPRIVGRRPRVRRVTRVVRHVDPWSVFKIAAVFSFVAYGIALLAGVLLWNVAYATGTIDNIERGLESTGWETFELNGAEIFRNAWIGGVFVAVGLTGFAVLAATLFNLVTDLVGGMRMTVLEEEVIEKPASPTRRYADQRRQPPAPPPGRPVPPPPRR